MSSLSDNESSGSSMENSLDTESEDYLTANEDFEAPELFDCVFDYSENVQVVEPIATQEEVESYEKNLAREEEEEEIFWSRYSGEDDVENWCSCSNCCLEHVENIFECRCCVEIEKCNEEMEKFAGIGCITDHPGYKEVCLNQFVLYAASTGLKTKAKRCYLTKVAIGDAEEHEFLRSVAYRQFVRLVWQYVGESKRIPLPCCVYNSIRHHFPTSCKYKGFEDEE